MDMSDELLSLDMGTRDCYYRFRRQRGTTKTVVYVYLQDLDIIAADRQTYGPSVIDDLRAIVEVWDWDWTTLTVFREGEKVRYDQDKWKPHFLSIDAARIDLPRLNILDLPVQHGYKNRVFLTQLDSRRQILKICPFEFEIPYFTQEIKAYKTLFERRCPLVPQLSAYVFERTEEQIVGFVCEEVRGTFAGPTDFAVCRDGLQQLHKYGIVHGDVNRFNIIITPNGPRFIDLERSVLDTDMEMSRNQFVSLQNQEFEKLEQALHNDEGWGKPWPEKCPEDPLEVLQY